MSIAYVAGNTASSASEATSQAVTIPDGISTGDVILIVASAVVLTATAPTLSAASTETAPVQAVTPVTGTESVASMSTGVWKVVAGADDAGATVTITSSASAYLSVAVAAYSGCNMTTPVDVIQGAFGGASTASVTCPAMTTGESGDWALYIGGGAAEGEAAPSIPSGATVRESSYSSSDVAAIITDSNGAAGGSGTAIGGGTFVAASPSNSLMAAFTIGLAAAAAPFSPFYVSTETGTYAGVQDWEVDTAINQPTTFNTGTGIRVLTPTAPDTAYVHSFIYTLPVNTGMGDTTYGNGIDVIQGLDAHNTYNMTVIEPSFGIQPWYADNPSNSGSLEETFMKDLAAWAATSEFATTGEEKHYLLGFSKSGIGGQGLQFRNPSVWYKTASWDAPFMMTAYDGTDSYYSGGTVEGDPTDSYGTAANFTDNYQLGSDNLTAWADAANFTSVQRLWIGGWYSFEDDVEAYETLLTSLGIKYNGTWFSEDIDHAWHPDWVSAALVSLYGASSGLLMAAGII